MVPMASSKSPKGLAETRTRSRRIAWRALMGALLCEDVFGNRDGFPIGRRGGMSRPENEELPNVPIQKFPH